MPVIRKPLPPVSKAYARLVRALTAELRRGATTGSPSAPEIIEEEQRGNNLHVTVLWDAWASVPHEDRGRAIMDAYQQIRPDDLLRISVAMGLTHAEAERLGVAVT